MIDKLIAIRAINNNASVNIVYENGNETITWLNGTAEISQADIDAKKAELQAIEDNKPNDQATGNQKLLDLGLTQAEATALTGYTPPVSE